MGPWDLRVMTLMGPRTLWMDPIIDVFIHWKVKDVSPGHMYLVTEESLRSFNVYMMKDTAISESLKK